MFKRSKKYIGYSDFWLILAGAPIMSFIVTGLLFSDIICRSPDFILWKCCFAGLVHVATFWLVFREIFFLGIRKFGKRNERYIFIAIGIGVSYFIFNKILKLIFDPFFGDLHAMGNKPHALLESLSALLVTAIVVLIYEGSFLTKRLHEVQLEKEQLASKNIASQLEGLKNKVSPHFLFNSLNTLCNLIPESPERAERFVRKLSKVYRYILEIRDKKLISLKEELDYLEAYTILLKERFGDNISIQKDIDQKYYDYNVVPLSLQILFENAIKHNIISKDKPLKISIYTDEQGKLVIKNNLQLKRSVSSSTKFGLENIKERYKYFTDMAVEVIPTIDYFIVIIPMIKKSQYVLES